MANIKFDSKDTFQKALERRLKRHDDSDAARKFAYQYFSQIPFADVLRKSWDDLEGGLLSSWNFFKSYDGGRAKVRVFDPVRATHGFDSKQTIVEVAARNVPFLLDSIRIGLGNQETVLTDVRQCLLNVIRQGASRIVTSDGDKANEMLLHLEVDRVINHKPLVREIQEIIRLVQRVVDDFVPMRRQLLLWSDELSGLDQAPALEETGEALKWLYANNFTFLFISFSL